MVTTPKSARHFDVVVGMAYANRIQLWSDGFYRTPKIHYDKTTLTGRRSTTLPMAPPAPRWPSTP